MVLCCQGESSGRCNGCDAPTDVSHALSCRRGGLVIRRHNEIRDSLGDLMAMGFNGIVNKEPIVREGWDLMVLSTKSQYSEGRRYS